MAFSPDHPATSLTYFSDHVAELDTQLESKLRHSCVANISATEKIAFRNI